MSGRAKAVYGRRKGALELDYRKLNKTPTRTHPPLPCSRSLPVAPPCRQLKLKTHLPPSPPGIPILGNALQVPPTEAWLTFTQWRKKHGPIFSLNMAGKHVVVLNTVQCANDLIDRRSSTYSNRPRFIMAAEIMSGGVNVGLMPYGELWRKMRRAMHDSLHMRYVGVYQSRQEWESAVLVSRLLVNPEEWDDHFKQATASLSLSVAYGEQLRDSDTRSHSMVQSINEIVHALSNASAPANTAWVELFPALLSLPESLASWKRRGREQFVKFSATYKGLVDGVREKVRDGSATESLTAALIEKEEKYGLDDEESAWLAGAVFGAGSETTSGVLVVFLLAMVLYPDVLKRAQAEVDSVVGRERMPSYGDQNDLPYIDAIVKEVLRWRPVAPLGIARQCVQDDWYDGHLIPAGTTVIANIWAMSHDAEFFPDPDEFIPERYLSEGKEPRVPIHPELAFGFGRRICPGRHFAYQSLYIFIASMVWAFDMTKTRDNEGNEVTPSRTACVDEGIVIRPAVFPCRILPRRHDISDIVARASAAVE